MSDTTGLRISAAIICCGYIYASCEFNKLVGYEWSSLACGITAACAALIAMVGRK